MEDFVKFIAINLAIILFSIILVLAGYAIMFIFTHKECSEYEHTYSNGATCFFTPAGEVIACIPPKQKPVSI